MAKVLIVDDSAFMRQRCAALLGQLGHEFIEAANGTLAVEVYEQASPDAVLLDITMPGVDGLTALRNIMALDPKARVVMVSAMGQQGVMMEALREGAKDFITKPFEQSRVKSALERALR